MWQTWQGPASRAVGYFSLHRSDESPKRRTITEHVNNRSSFTDSLSGDGEIDCNCVFSFCFVTETVSSQEKDLDQQRNCRALLGRASSGTFRADLLGPDQDRDLAELTGSSGSSEPTAGACSNDVRPLRNLV
jgi:hypothetical protein